MDHCLRHIIRIAIVLFGFVAVTGAQVNDAPKPAPSPSEVAAVAEYCRELNTYAGLHPKEARFFGDAAAYDQSGVTLTTPRPRWREYKSAKARDAATTPDNLFNTANVWLRNGKVVFARFQYGSPSGDWAQIVGYCFREDGSLAKLENSFRIIPGSNVRIEKARIYDAKGKLLRSSQQCFDLDTRRKKRCGSDYRNYDADVFGTVKQLPIYGLIKSRGAIK